MRVIATFMLTICQLSGSLSSTQSQRVRAALSTLRALGVRGSQICSRITACCSLMIRLSLRCSRSMRVGCADGMRRVDMLLRGVLPRGSLWNRRSRELSYSVVQLAMSHAFCILFSSQHKLLAGNQRKDKQMMENSGNSMLFRLEQNVSFNHTMAQFHSYKSSMGSSTGVIWNHSDLPIQYLIYGAFEEIATSRTQTTLSPKLDLNFRAGIVSLEGFHSITDVQINPKYAESFVEVPPRRHSSVGLIDLGLNEHKISVRVKVGNFVKYLMKDVVIKSVRDMRLKVRYDLSLKVLGEQEAGQLIDRDEERSEARREREVRQGRIYQETLTRLQSIRVP